MPDAVNPPGQCWFCGQRRGDASSFAQPFWHCHDESVRVVIIPRCATCLAHHEQQKFPSGLFLIGVVASCMMVMKLLASWLSIADGYQTLLMVIAMLAGLLAGLVFVAQREKKLAELSGTKPSACALQHPDYQVLAADSKQWRQRFSAASTTGSYRRETVSDRRVEFQQSALYANAAIALEQAVQASGIAA